MRMWILAAGAAALAVTTPALADPKGGGQGGGKDRGAKAERGGGQSKAARGGDRRQVKADRGPNRDPTDSSTASIGRTA